MEIIEGIVTVSPPPSKDHNTTAELLQRRLYTVIPEDWGIYQTLGVPVPGRAGLYIPDLVVVPRVLDTVEYGGKLTLPKPFGLDLDTGAFPVS